MGIFQQKKLEIRPTTPDNLKDEIRVKFRSTPPHMLITVKQLLYMKMMDIILSILSNFYFIAQFFSSSLLV